MKKLITLIVCAVIPQIGASQIWTEDFESGGTYTASAGECTDNAYDYFILTDGSNINDTPTSGVQGSNYFAAQDIDASGCPAIGGANATLDWDDIDISGCTSLTFDILLAEPSNYDGWDNDEYVHIYYDIDNSGTWSNLLWIENDGSGNNGPTLIDTDFDGVGDGTTLGFGMQNFSVAIAGTGSVIDIRIEFELSDGGANICLDNLVIDGSCGCSGVVAEPTVDVSSDNGIPGCTSGEITWTNGNNDNSIVVFSTSPITWTPTDGTNYSVGDIVAGGVTVVYNGSGTSATVTGLSQGTTYYYAIYGYDGTQANCEENYLVGGQTGSFTTDVNCAESYIQSINYNACTNAEGTDEIIFVQIGDNDVNVDDIVIDLPNSQWCNSGCGGNTIGNNQTHIDDLNTMAGCTPDIFTYCDPIPAGASLMIFTGDPPSYVVDYSNNCNGQTYCAIFINNTSTVGNFSNSASTPRTTTINFGNGDVSTVTYTASNGLCDCDGATANFDETGALTEYVQYTDCVYPLAVNLKSFSGYKEDYLNILEWSAEGNDEAASFMLESSETGEHWKTIEVIQAKRNVLNSTYTVEDNSFYSGVTYYRLVTLDYNGKRNTSNIISIDRDIISIYLENNNLTVGFEEAPNKTYTLNIYDTRGALLYSGPAENNMTVPWTNKGFFVVEIPEKGLQQKLIAQ